MLFLSLPNTSFFQPARNCIGRYFEEAVLEEHVNENGYNYLRWISLGILSPQRELSNIWSK